MPLPPLDNPCLGYVCGVPDGAIPGVTISDCQDQGYSGTLAGCVDPRCVGWRPSIPRCGPPAYRALQVQSDPIVDPFAGFLAQDMMFDGTGRTGRGCSSCSSVSSPLAGLGGDSGPSDFIAALDGSGCDGGFLGNFPWWLLVLLIILVVKWS